MPFFVRGIWKRIFFSGQKSARERRRSQPTPGKVSCKKRKQSLEKASDRERSLSSTCSGMSLGRKKRERNLNIEARKDKFDLICFPSTSPTYWKKEREKLKGFRFIISKLVNEVCYMHQSDIFSSTKKKRKSEKKKKKRTVARRLCLILTVGLMLPVF